MVFTRFLGKNGPQLALIEGDKLVPLGAYDLIDYLEDNRVPRGQPLPVKDTELLCPLEEATRVFCLGKNYLDHVEELQGTGLSDRPKDPIYFMKAPRILSSDGDTIKDWQGHTSCLDYEVELVLIIGKEARDLEKSQVQDVVFGYMIGNDFTARDLQHRHSQWLKGKSLDGFTSLSTRVFTKDELAYPPEIELRLFVNEELRQRGNTRDLLFDIDELVSELSQGLTLYPGDLIFTGTPSGVAMGMKPPVYLKRGDLVRCEIQGLGSLSNYIG